MGGCKTNGRDDKGTRLNDLAAWLRVAVRTDGGRLAGTAATCSLVQVVDMDACYGILARCWTLHGPRWTLSHLLFSASPTAIQTVRALAVRASSRSILLPFAVHFAGEPGCWVALRTPYNNPFRSPEVQLEMQRIHESGIAVVQGIRLDVGPDQAWVLSCSACLAQWALPKVAATTSGKTSVASAYTLTLCALARILPHETASSGRAPESEPSY